MTNLAFAPEGRKRFSKNEERVCPVPVLGLREETAEGQGPKERSFRQ